MDPGPGARGSPSPRTCFREGDAIQFRDVNETQILAIAIAASGRGGATLQTERPG